MLQKSRYRVGSLERAPGVCSGGVLRRRWLLREATRRTRKRPARRGSSCRFIMGLTGIATFGCSTQVRPRRSPRSVSFLGFVYRRREFLDLLQHLVPSMPWTVQEVSSVGNRRKLGCPSGSQITLHRVQVLGTRPVIPRASHVENWKFQVARVPELLALGKQVMLFSKCPRDSYARRRS